MKTNLKIISQTNSPTPALGDTRLRCAPMLTAVLLSLLFGFSAARADTITVNSTADLAGFNPGITVATLGAIVTLREALNAANNTVAETISFAPS